VGSIQIFPHFADGGGWRTEIALVNPTDSELAGTILFKDQSGTALTMTLDGRTNSSFVYSIPPRMSQKLATAGSPEAVLSGSMTILPAAQSVPPVGLAVFSLRQGSITVSQAGVVAMNSARAYRLYGEASGDFDKGATGSRQTGFAIVNNSNATAVVAVELFRLDGSAVGLTGTLVVQAGGQTTKFLSQIPGLESLALPFKGVVRVSSLSTISVIGLRCRYNERNDFLFTTTPAMDESATATDAELVFPHFVQGGGYTTQFVLFSGSPGQQTSGAMRFVPNQAGAQCEAAVVSSSMLTLREMRSREEITQARSALRGRSSVCWRSSFWTPPGHQAAAFVDAAAPPNGDGSLGHKFVRITDALERARAIRRESAVQIVIHVGPGVYVGSYTSTGPGIEPLPIRLDVPGLKLFGTTAMERDELGLPTGVIKPGSNTLLLADPPLESIIQSFFVVGSASDETVIDRVTVANLSLNAVVIVAGSSSRSSAGLAYWIIT
jgi:hypothetical protein